MGGKKDQVKIEGSCEFKEENEEKGQVEPEAAQEDRSRFAEIFKESVIVTSQEHVETEVQIAKYVALKSKVQERGRIKKKD